MERTFTKNRDGSPHTCPDHNHTPRAEEAERETFAVVHVHQSGTKRWLHSSGWPDSYCDSKTYIETVTATIDPPATARVPHAKEGCVDCAAKDAVIRDLRACLKDLQEEFCYIDACEPGMNTKECRCHSGAKAMIRDAEEALCRTR